MGVSSDGQICYGVLLDEDVELPWDAEEWEGDIEEWWLRETGFNLEVWGSDGGRLPGVTEKQIEEYYKARREWEGTHPLPIEAVNVCSADYPTYILAVPSTCLTARRGYPEKFLPFDVGQSLKPEGLDRLLDFCRQYGIEYEGEPEWYLSSYLG